MARTLGILGLGVALLAGAPAAAQQQQALVPSDVPLAENAQTAIAAAWLSPEERSAMRVFHGVWGPDDLATPQLKAIVALNAWQLDDAVFDDPAVPVETRAEARILKGQLREALALLEGANSVKASMLKAQAHEGLGELGPANAVIDAPVRELLRRTFDEAGELTSAVQALVIRSRLEGQPARHYQTMMDLLGRAHQELDRLYWPAKLTEAELLLDKDNLQEAVGALHETLTLNPRCAAAWYALGRIAVDRFDFGSAQAAADALKRINATHPLAAMLLAESSLIQDDPEQALILLEPMQNQWPSMRPVLELLAASLAVRFDEEHTDVIFKRYDELSPGSARPYFVTGRHLAYQRQYEWAATLLEEAVRRQPAWPAPQLELGLLELQSGRDGRALEALRSLRELDPFNKRAANSLLLMEELAAYPQIESEHFIIRHAPGIHQVFAELMPEQMERIHALVAGRFEHEPAQKTVIEILPDHERFAVRITSMPHIHTLAACTGPVIALEAPMEGPPQKHLGPFDWPRVLQHEYTHTITLSQTRNRIPHWLTEAAAVSMEPAPRDFERCQLLARSLDQGELFTLDTINWGFIRPRKPSDRALAYAQGHWMVEYMNQRFGSSALIRLLERFFHGDREASAMREVLGISREEFMTGFLEWARKDVESWGMAAKPSMTQLTDQLREQDPDLSKFMDASRQARLDMIAKALVDRVGAPARLPGDQKIDPPLEADQWPALMRPPVEIDDQTLARWRGEYPDHPDLLELDIRRKLEHKQEMSQVQPLLERYMELRPVDPWPHRVLAEDAISRGDGGAAMPHLEYLDAREQSSTIYAVELARLYRQQKDTKAALAKIMRAVCINPYAAANRELAAAIAIEAGDFALARRHIVALTLIEPGRPQHQTRLARLDELISKSKP